MTTLRGTLFFLLLATTSIWCVNALYNLHGTRKIELLSYLTDLQEPLARASTLEFTGVVSDHLMLKTLTFLGQYLISKEEPAKEEWGVVYRTLQQCINLDPRFMDAYVLAQTTLPDDAGMVRETNELLEKGTQVFIDNYRLHLFLWYNYFTLLNDPVTAGKHMQIAARMPGAPAYFSTLAARTDLYAGKIHAAVIFLEETLKDTRDPALRDFLGMRLETLKRIGFLEFKVQEYKKRFNKLPQTIQELVDSGVITKIPPDPYGGEFYIMENGRVYTTSKLVMQKSVEK